MQVEIRQGSFPKIKWPFFNGGGDYDTVIIETSKHFGLDIFTAGLQKNTIKKKNSTPKNLYFLTQIKLIQFRGNSDKTTCLT